MRTMRGNRIPMTNVRQRSCYTCGPAALCAILHYWGEFTSEETLAIEMGSDPVGGTSPDKIRRAALDRGYSTLWKESMSNQELKSYLEEGKPIIIVVQAWATTPAELNGDGGHYVIAIDYDEDNVYFEDPALDDARGYIPWGDLDTRWHDTDKAGKLFSRFGLVIWKDESPVMESVTEAVSLILHKDKDYRH